MASPNGSPARGEQEEDPRAQLHACPFNVLSSSWVLNEKKRNDWLFVSCVHASICCMS